MTDDTYGSDFDRAGTGLDHDDSIRRGAASIGSALAEEGPEAIFDQIEELLPKPVREQVVNFPITAMLLGIGIGIFLGMKKGDELISAGSAMISATAATNFGKFMEQMPRG